MFKYTLYTLAILIVGIVTSISATVITVAEKAKTFESSLPDVDVYTFNNLPYGYNKNVTWDGVGAFDALNVIAGNQYGGAPDEKNATSAYSVQGIGSPVKTTTLTLNSPSSYFGLYWSAGDTSNMLQFYNGKNLVAQVTTSTIMASLTKEYYGNPVNKSQNRGEPYAFLNFYGDNNTSWDKVVLTNSSNSGFESDNYTSRIAAWDALADPAITSTPVAIVEGAKVTTITSLPEKWNVAAPAAPAPPLYILGIFAAMFMLRRRR